VAVVRKNELKELAEAELREKLNELRQELMSQNAKIASGGLPDNPGKLGEIKRTIARIYTIAGEKGYKI
jgi:large subunit ribosomal protein L29